MDWSKTKSIFIVVFLVLDIFLLSLFIQKLSDNKLGLFVQTSTEKQLAADNIVYPQLPETTKEETRITAKPKAFTEEDLKTLKGQKAEMINNNTTIYSQLDKPYVLGEKFGKDEFNAFIKSFTFEGGEYEFWKYDEKNMKVIYHQSYKDRPLFMNFNGEITLNLNENKEIVSYKQTMLTSFDKIGDKELVLLPIKAIELLRDNKKILSDSEIIDYGLGYSTWIPLAESQVLSPTWHFVVEKDGKKEDLFINAIEGKVIEMENQNTETLE
ncbi:two-component system regulatory protein YycI [Rossellomorea sp. BNER]|uniref:two-component system regulatory protein YycI n=1 Tax=Rossellomorea sp. BNER TaxID=2962031 RepID=UPI003AF20C6D|nr:two-component system regulatory protein YycI [Rossellomorea sp. BNER]